MPQPEDYADRIRKLEREVRDLRSSLTNQAGATSASLGWHIPSGSLPTAPDDGGHLTTLGSEPYWTESSGAVYSLKNAPFPQGGFVAAPAAMTAGAAPGSYSSSHSNALVTDIAEVRLQLIRLLNSLKGSSPPIISNF
ncbi:hypothetical protein [Nonomuraea sp. WAC 01424]|uniref:hypothetical protein n=1 Tax=Nonomuraea sp. WAC 01424 TaxID=2203200 RepID=UPI000F76DEB0|nr:hypothetical protein [Nonomuraea sp. WAC 01424]